jgi:hypothetical protein
MDTAFAARVPADAKMMQIAPADLEAKVNVNGSSITLGHPVAATGTIRTVTLLYELRRRDGCYELVPICGGGGHGIAAVVGMEPVKWVLAGIPVRGVEPLNPAIGQSTWTSTLNHSTITYRGASGDGASTLKAEPKVRDGRSGFSAA